MAVTLCLSCSPDAQPQVQRPTLMGDGFLYCILSASSLDPNSSGLSEGPFGRCGFLYHISSVSVSNSTATVRRTQLPWLLSWLSYIIVQRPLDRPLDLWNRMFNRHQAEITVMQFTGTLLRCISLWVYHGNILARPISSANFRQRDFLSKLSLECVTSFWYITLQWHFCPSQKVNIQHVYTYIYIYLKCVCLCVWINIYEYICVEILTYISIFICIVIIYISVCVHICTQ